MQKSAIAYEKVKNMNREIKKPNSNSSINNRIVH